MKKIVILAPHPDDETIGCGGTLLKHIAQGHEVHWIILTQMSPELYTSQQREARDQTIKEVKKMYGFTSISQLKFNTSTLEDIEFSRILDKVEKVFQKIKPSVVYLPYPNDAHSDHKIVYRVGVACSKWFRHPYVEKVLVYETLSETNFPQNITSGSFNPNYYVNISEYLNDKLKIMDLYDSELGDHPFPRSIKAVESLAVLHGSTSGYDYAEAFMLYKERVN